MGEAKRKQTLKDRIIERQPFCVYCGGETPATTVDHMPPITMFDLRDRPKGLEFSACHDCNMSSSKVDLVAGLMSRIFPNSERAGAKEELGKIMKNVNRFNPGLLEEMRPSRDKLEGFLRKFGKMPPNIGGPLNASGPLLNAAMNKFAAKLGLALHYHTTGSILPVTGALGVRWFSNFEAWQGKLPEELVGMFPNPKTLKQGQKHVSDQFLYDSIHAPEAGMSGHYATFRNSFAVMAIAAEVDNEAVNEKTKNMFRPGCLKN